MSLQPRLTPKRLMQRYTNLLDFLFYFFYVVNIITVFGIVAAI